MDFRSFTGSGLLADHICPYSKLGGGASKTCCQLGILSRPKSILGKCEPSTYKAFICSSLEYGSPLWAGAPASHLALLIAMEAKALKIIGATPVEAESGPVTLTMQTDRWRLCLLPPLLLLHPLPFSCSCLLSLCQNLMIDLPNQPLQDVQPLESLSITISLNLS